jgi:apolipoprotein N-acyltransferase
MLVPRYGLFAAPCLWVALELLRTYLFTGLPWSLLGYSQYRQLDVIQIADHLGVYGVSFLIVLTNVALAELYLWLMPLFRGFRPARLPWELVTTSAMLVGLSWAYSTSLIVSEGMEQLKASLRVGVVQPNIDQAVKWDQAYRDETLRRYDRLTESFGYGVDLVVWPEAATPFIYEREPVYQLQLVSMASRASAPLLFGSPAVRFDAERKPFLLNSAYLLSPQGQLLGRYDKQHLVPFGEYIPLKSSLLFFLDKLVEGIGDFQAGPGPIVLSFQPSADSSFSRSVKFGVVICYEVIFPDLVRRMALGGAEFLVTITNDAWFGDSSAPFQHFAMFGFHRPFRAHHRSLPPVYRSCPTGDDSGSANADLLQPPWRCLCLRLYVNLPAALAVRLVWHQGSRTGRDRGDPRLKERIVVHAGRNSCSCTCGRRTSIGTSGASLTSPA